MLLRGRSPIDLYAAHASGYHAVSVVCVSTVPTSERYSAAWELLLAE